MRRLLRSPSIRRVLVLLAPVLIGVAGAWLAMLAVGRTTVTMGPFRVELSSRFGRGVTDIALPPLGRLTADTHLSPLRVRATLLDVNVPQLTDLLRDRSVDVVAAGVERDALAEVVPYALRLLVVSVSGALALALVVFRRRWRPVAMATLAALVVVGGSETIAWLTYRPSAFLAPTFSGSLALAPRLIGPVQRATDRLEDFRVELSRVVDGAVRAYTSIEQSTLGGREQIRVLHISDIHLSPLGLAFARQIAAGFDVDFVVDTGDLTSFGTPAEQLILEGIPAFDRPYLFVRGNHDSMGLQRAMADVPNVLVLDGTSVEQSGVRVYGLGDPAFTPNQRTALDEEEVAALARGAGARVLRDVEEMPDPPDIVAVHDDRMAESVSGRVPLVISGHFHEESARVTDGTLYLRVGTTGGAGATVFTQTGGIPLSAEVLYFDPGNPPRLVAFDVITQQPETGSLTVKRHLVAEEFGSLSPSPPPTPASTGSPSASLTGPTP